MIELLIFRSTPGDMGRSNPLVLLLSLRCISRYFKYDGVEEWGQCSFVHLFVVCLVDSLTFGSRVYADGLWH